MQSALGRIPSEAEGEGTTERGALAVTVDQVMTCPVVVVHAQATLGSMAHLLRRHRISGLPVVDDDDRLVGVVSESDLLRRLIRAELLKVFADQAPISAGGRESRATAETAEGLMSQPAISTPPEASADEALELIRRRAVRRLPVVDGDGRVIGIVTRTDLLQPYACTDQELHDELCGEVLPRLGVDPGQIRLEVESGSVLLGGTLPGSELVAQVEATVRDTPGVVFVESRLRAHASPFAGKGP